MPADDGPEGPVRQFHAQQREVTPFVEAVTPHQNADIADIREAPEQTVRITQSKVIKAKLFDDIAGRQLAAAGDSA